MLLNSTCITRIDQVLEAAENPASAYLVRTRLQRMLVSVGRSLARDFDVTVKAPTELQVPEGASHEFHKAIVLLNELVAESRHLAQRSESLDARWREGWSRLRTRLVELRRLLVDSATST
jgi:hypothetical protein